MDIDKKALSERGICTKYVTPALVRSGWTHDQIREDVTFADERIRVHGQSVTCDKPKRVDYVLYLTPNQPIAVIALRRGLLGRRALQGSSGA